MVDVLLFNSVKEIPIFAVNCEQKVWGDNFDSL